MATILPVDLGERGYRVHIGHGLAATVGAAVAAVVPGRRVLLATDAAVGPVHAEAVRAALAAAGFEVRVATLESGEPAKNLASVRVLWDALVAGQYDRQSVVVALGGGVVGDTAGFAAATYARGVAFVPLPTTLLAMVDASVGGKVGVDLGPAKNIVGAFHQPKAVLCDPAWLATLPERDYRCGLAEVVKHGAALDAEYFSFVEANADGLLARDPALLEETVAGSVRLKAAVVERDEFERTGLRAVLNFGHTFGHALEVAGNYRELRHGEAVSVGMVCAARLAERLGRVDLGFLPRLAGLLERFGLPTVVPPALFAADLLGLMRGDKKAVARSIRLVLPTRLGHAEIVAGVDERAILDAMGATLA